MKLTTQMRRMRLFKATSVIGCGALTILAVATACKTPSGNSEILDANATASASSGFVKCEDWFDAVANHPNDERCQRGQPWEFDRGPDPETTWGKEWVDLFSQTPNYRAVGIYTLGGAATDDKFRWNYGPMYYRGRLEPQQVRVFVIGQEGAQDENLSNRSFTGSTGTKMQNLLRVLGINRSYLFMNTFVYTINGQYDSTDANILRLSQNMSAPIVKHRHALFDNMLKNNGNVLNLVIGVGAAGKDTAVTWVQHLWMQQGLSLQDAQKKCRQLSGPNDWDSCELPMPGVRAIGVPHPGGASPANGGAGALANITTTFKKAVVKVADWKKADPNWLPGDAGVTARLGDSYEYGNTSVPFRDFPFGTPWRLGQWGTSSNRKGADALQIFSSAGDYGGQASYPAEPMDAIAFPSDVRLLHREAKFDMLAKKGNRYGWTASLDATSDQDIPWEPARSLSLRYKYDQGPSEEFAKLFMGQEAGLEWPDFWAGANGVKATSHRSLGYTSLYRGRLSGPKVLVLADQESQDDMFSFRAFSGRGGQLFQSFLDAAGVSTDYAIIRTLPVDTLGMPVDQVKQLALDPKAVALRTEIFRRLLAANKTKVIIAVGPVAEAAYQAMVGNLDVRGINVLALADANTSGVEQLWAKELMAKRADLQRDLGQAEAGTSGNFAFDGKLRDIPRIDFPFHQRIWFGTMGSRAIRSTSDVGDYYKTFAPRWVGATFGAPLSPADKATIDATK